MDIYNLIGPNDQSCIGLDLTHFSRRIRNRWVYGIMEVPRPRGITINLCRKIDWPKKTP